MAGGGGMSQSGGMVGLMSTLNAMHHQHTTTNADELAGRTGAGDMVATAHAHAHALPLIAVCVSTTSRGVVKKGRVKIMSEADRKQRLEEVDQVRTVLGTTYSRW